MSTALLQTTSSFRKKTKNYKLLGADDEEEEQRLATEAALQAALEKQNAVPLTVETADVQEFPPDVWAAACSCSDKGEAVLKAYQEVATLREVYREHLINLQFSQETQASHHSNFPNSVFTSGSQLWAPTSKTKLPPLVGTQAFKTTGADITSNSNTVFNSANKAGKQAPGSLKQPSTIGADAYGGLNFTKAVKITQDVRKLNLFERQQAVWADVASELANRTGRPTHDIAMERGHEYRSRFEVLEALNRAMPLTDRAGGPESWKMSLRNAWERVVPVGSLFSGLTMTAKEQPSVANSLTGSAGKGKFRPKSYDMAGQRLAQERIAKIGRPLDPCFTASHVEATSRLSTARPTTTTPPPDHVALQGRSLTRRGRDWQHNETLKSRLEQYASAINKQLPHNPDLPDLYLTGQSLAAILAGTLSSAADLQDVLLHLEHSNPEAAAEVAELLPQIQLQDPSADQALNSQRESTQGVDQGAVDGTDLDGALPGIHLSASCQRVFLNCVPGQHASAELSLTNSGTVAMQYRWQRQLAAPHPIATSTQSSQNQPQSCIHVLKASGVLLPGATHTSTVMFKPSSAGVFSEIWTLHAIPALPSDHAAVAVQIQAASFQPPSGKPALEALDQELQQAEKMAKVNAAVDRILANVHPVPAKNHQETEEERLSMESWDRANGHESPPLYWPGHEIVTQLHDAYRSARAALISVLSPPLPVQPAADAGKGPKKATAGGAKPASGKAGKNASQEAPTVTAPVTKWPEIWSGKVSDFLEIINELRQKSAPEQTSSGKSGEVSQQAEHVLTPEEQAVADAKRAAHATAQQLQHQLDAILSSQAARVPRDARQLMRHAVRAALLRVADVVEAKLDALHAEQDKKLAAAIDKLVAGGLDPAAAATQASTAVNAKAFAEKVKTGAKSQIKQLVPMWWEEMGQENSAAAAWIAQALSLLDTRMRAPHDQAERAEDGEEMYRWARFALLREVERLGLPAVHA